MLCQVHSRSCPRPRSEVMSLNFHDQKPQVPIAIHASPRVSIILFSLGIIHEGEQRWRLSSGLSSHPPSQAGIFLTTCC